MTDPGHTPAEGYAASLRQQAEWSDRGKDTFCDSDELRAVAAFIEQQSARIAGLEVGNANLMGLLQTGHDDLYRGLRQRIAELESQVETLTGLLDVSADVLAKAARTQAFKEAVERAKQLRLKHGSPVGDAYVNGVWDHGARIEAAILALDTAPTEQNKGAQS